MPVMQRKQLRQDLGLRRLHETIVATTSLSLGANANVAVMSRLLANPDNTGNTTYLGSFLRVASADYRVGSVNFGSGALYSGQALLNAIASGADFEVHNKLSAPDLDQAIDETILALRVRREVALPTTAGIDYYPLDNAASPNTIVNVLNAYYFANPGSSVNRDRGELVGYEIVMTATGREIRLPSDLGGSMQIVLDAVLALSLGSSDVATINLPSEDLVLWGAAAKCYDLLIQNAPSQEAGQYERRRMEAARSYTYLARRWMPTIEKRLRFETGFEDAGWGGG